MITAGRGGGGQGMHQKGRDHRGGPQRRLNRRLEEVAKAVGGGYCRLQMLLRLAFAVRETANSASLPPMVKPSMSHGSVLRITRQRSRHAAGAHACARARVQRTLPPPGGGSAAIVRHIRSDWTRCGDVGCTLAQKRTENTPSQGVQTSSVEDFLLNMQTIVCTRKYPSAHALSLCGNPPLPRGLTGGGSPQGCIGKGGRGPPPPSRARSLCPATCQASLGRMLGVGWDAASNRAQGVHGAHAAQALPAATRSGELWRFQHVPRGGDVSSVLYATPLQVRRPPGGGGGGGAVGRVGGGGGSRWGDLGW